GGHGDSGRADHAALTVAERSCRTADRLDPTRVPRPCRGVGEKAPPSSVGELRDLLQPGAHAPCARRGCSAPSTCADSRAYRISHLARRSPSALHSDDIIGRHRKVTFVGRPATGLGKVPLKKGHAVRRALPKTCRAVDKISSERTGSSTARASVSAPTIPTRVVMARRRRAAAVPLNKAASCPNAVRT